MNPSLSPTEREVLVLVARGRQRKQIARDMGIGLRTIDTHLDAVFAKLGAINAPHAVAKACHAGLLPEEA